MKIGPKYKIARRLGAHIFDKTQTQKFALSKARRSEKEFKHRSFVKSDFGTGLIEKQRVRFYYGISERQFSRYAAEVIGKKASKQEEGLYEKLERRLDNVVYRIGLAPSRRAARQMVSHGHILVNGRRVKVPSYEVSAGDGILVREGSRRRAIFSGLAERLKDKEMPYWLSFDPTRFEGKVNSLPAPSGRETIFDLKAVIEFYKR